MDIYDLKIDEIKPNLKKKLELKKGTTFGVEIEAEDIDPNKIIKMSKNSTLNNWQFKDDRSLKYGCSIELASPIFEDTKESYLDIKKACKLLKQENANVSENSSLQIHFGIQIFNNNFVNLEEFYKLWTIFEHIIYRYSYGENKKARKEILEYARPISIYLKNKLEETKNKDMLNLSRIIGAEKKNAISFRYKEEENQIKINTIEIRTINGTLDHILIQNYIYFFYKLINYVTLSKYEKDKIEYLFKNFDKTKSFSEYSNIFFDDAVLLTELIFDSEIDKSIFLKNYLGEDIKKYTK